MSETKINIYKKIFNAKKEIVAISKDSTNPFFKSNYFDINKILSEVEPILEKNNLLLLQPIKAERVKTIIIDVESGESIKSVMHLPISQDPQKLGSAITYYRRYTLQSLLGLQAEDDDAQSFKTESKKDTPKIDFWLTDDQFKKVKELTKEQIKDCLQKYNGQSFEDGKVYGMKKIYRQELTKLSK